MHYLEILTRERNNIYQLKIAVYAIDLFILSKILLVSIVGECVNVFID